MDLERVRAFLTVIESGSLLSASEKLDVSRPTLKRRIEELEEQLGTPLIVSTHQGVQPTPAGEKLAVEGRQMLLEYQSLMASLSEIDQAPSGELNIVQPVGMPPWFWTPILATLKNTHPDLSLRIQISDAPLQELLHGFDIALVVGAQEIEGDHKVHTIMSVTERLIAHKDYLAERGTPQTLEELEGHDLFVWKNPHTQETDLPLLGGGVARIRPRFVSADLELLRQCAMNRLGIAFMPYEPLPSPDMSQDLLVHVLPDHCGRRQTARFIVPEVLAHTPRVRTFTEAMLGFMSTVMSQR